MRHSPLTIALATIWLAGCGSDDSPAPVTEATVALSDYGVIRIDLDTGTAQTALDAVFCDLTTPSSAALVDQQFLTDADSCEVSNDTENNTDDETALLCSTALPAQSVSAGSNLLFSSAAGSYADLAQQISVDNITYSTDSALPRPPNGLTLDIPGDDFPAFTAVQIPDLQDLQIIAPATGEPLRSDTTITWNAATDAANSRLILTASDADVTIDCSLADDGSFSFSAATQAELGELFAASNISIRRQNVTSPTRGDSGLVIITSIR
jgi:hypothetical protein